MSRFEVVTSELESAAGVLRGVAGEAGSGGGSCGSMGEGAMEAALGGLFARAGEFCGQLSEAAAGNARNLGAAASCYTEADTVSIPARER
jgi:hypothetical protein